MAGGVNLNARQQGLLPPTNPISPDEAYQSITSFINVNQQNASEISFQGVQSANRLVTGISSQSSNTTADNASYIGESLARLGINFQPTQNPLNSYANYTYHIRWFMTDENTAYNRVDRNNPNGDNLNKTIIAESGVTAGFNITDFEMENTCGPNDRTLNTSALNWTMTVTEPYGISLIDKIRSAAKTQPVINYMRTPYFIDIWFTGYDENGNIVQDKLFYQLFRVSITNMDVNLTEGGSKYTIIGTFDNDLGFSNQVSMPQGGFTVQAKNVGDFFKLLAEKLTEQQKLALQQDFPEVEYQINVPPEIKNWTFRSADVENQDNRNDDMSIEWNDGTMNVTITPGTSMETIVNRVISMCPEADAWVKGENGGTAGNSNSAEITKNGLATWLMVHSDVKITGYNYYTRDYLRKVTYSLVIYKTARTGADSATLSSLESGSVQKEKINFLKNNNALKKLYQYIYTGENTEIIRFDIRIENLWAVTLPVWEGVNNYSNYTQGLLKKDNAIADQLREGTYTKRTLLSSLQTKIEQLQSTISNPDVPQGVRNATLGELEDVARDALLLETSLQSAVYFGGSPGELTISSIAAKNAAITQEAAEISTLQTNQRAKRFAEDVRTIPAKSEDPMPIVIKPDNQPSGQNATQSSDSNKSVANPNSLGLPSGRSFIGTILSNMFDGTFFNRIELEIRGDPYWMGQSNIRQNLIAENFGKGASDARFANFQVCDNFFVLVFRTGENYSERTGLMEFTDSSEFFNGAYSVIKVKNTFRNGSFTQVLDAAKDIFAQKVSNEVSSAVVQSAATASTTSYDATAAATAAGTSDALVAGAAAFGGGGL